MFRGKSISLILAAVLAVAGCGGGGGDSNLNRADSGSMNNGAPAGSTPGGTAGEPNPAPNNPVNEPRLSGQLVLIANQMPYIDGDRDQFPMEYNAVDLDNFESNIGLYGVASGTSDGAVNTGFPATAPAPAAPVARFGFRVDKVVAPLPNGAPVSEETVAGRIAFSFAERDDSPGMQPNRNELMSFVLDRVLLTTRRNEQTGLVELESAELVENSRMHVYGRNSAGTEVRQTIPVQSNAVRLEPVSNIIDDYGDTSSVILMVDLEAAFAQGVEQLAALNNMAGHFSMNVTMSFAQLLRPSSEADNGTIRPERNLVGQSITVNDQPAVNGAGISGNVWIRAYPPQ